MADQRLAQVKTWLEKLQQAIADEIAAVDGIASFNSDAWQRDSGGGGRTMILKAGGVFEQAGIGFSHVMGDALPPSATAKRPELAGKPWQAVGVSLVFHPLSPMIPTTHMNVRYFQAGEGDNANWWFGGGYDLTPYYLFAEDCRHWHQAARNAVQEFGADRYSRFKQWCDEYFFLKHRNEARGIGGLFFDDYAEGGFDSAFAMTRQVGESFIPAYIPIVNRRRSEPWSEAERQFQLYRRGRYVEFNLVWDRGTLFGLQSGGRTESILMSLPPLVRFEYGYEPVAGSAEAELHDVLRHPREWI